MRKIICDLIAKILELIFIIIMAINLASLRRHLCCDMDGAVVLAAILFSLLSVCILFQIILIVSEIRSK